MQSKEQAFGDLKETVFKAYIVLIRRQGGNLGLLLLQSTQSLANCAVANVPGTDSLVSLMNISRMTYDLT